MSQLLHHQGKSRPNGYTGVILSAGLSDKRSRRGLAKRKDRKGNPAGSLGLELKSTPVAQEPIKDGPVDEDIIRR